MNNQAFKAVYECLCYATDHATLQRQGETREASVHPKLLFVCSELLRWQIQVNPKYVIRSEIEDQLAVISSIVRERSMSTASRTYNEKERVDAGACRTEPGVKESSEGWGGIRSDCGINPRGSDETQGGWSRYRLD